MRFLRHTFTGLFLASVALGLLIYALQMVRGAVEDRMANERPSPPARERVFAVSVITATPQSEVPVLEAFGEIRAVRSLELRAAASGSLVELSQAFIEGGSVVAGDILLRVDPIDAELARDRVAADMADARAEVTDAEAGLALARDELTAAQDQEALRVRALERQQDLARRGVGTSAAVESAELAVSTARATVLARRQAVTQAQARIAQSATRLTRSEIALAEAERRVADTVLTAPFDGALSDVTLTAGRRVSANEKLATLIDQSALEVAFRLSTAQYIRLLGETGELTARPVEVALEASGITVTATGEISRDSAAVGAAETGRLVFARLGLSTGLKPGDFVTVRVEEPAIPNVVRLPAGALDGSGTVLVLGDGDRLEALPVELLRRQGNSVLINGAGLAGREVVTARTPLLGAGIAVRPLRQGAEVEAPAMLELSDERRARLVAFVETGGMPAEVKTRLLNRLSGDKVPAQLVERLESRMGS